MEPIYVTYYGTGHQYRQEIYIMYGLHETEAQYRYTECKVSDRRKSMKTKSLTRNRFSWI